MGTQATPAGVELESIKYHPESRTHRAQYDQDTTTASMAVVAVLSTVRNCGPTDLEPLAESIDPDALDELATGTSNGSISIMFHAGEYAVTVDSDGDIAVGLRGRTGLEDRADRGPRA